EACRLIALDEIAHHGLFLKIMHSAIKYFPAPTFEVLAQVFAGFELPALRFLPNGHHLLRAIRRTGIYSPAIYRENIYTPLLQSWGLGGHEAFEKAVHGARQLPADLDPDSRTLQRTGEWVAGDQLPQVTT